MWNGRQDRGTDDLANVSISRLDIGLSKIVALEEKWLSARFGQGIGKAVAEVEPSLVTAFAVVKERLARQMAMLDRYGLDNDAGPSKQHVDLAFGFYSELTFNDHRQFNKTSNTEPANFRIVEQLHELCLFRLTIENRNERRGIDDHFGRPFSS